MILFELQLSLEQGFAEVYETGESGFVEEFVRLEVHNAELVELLEVFERTPGSWNWRELEIFQENLRMMNESKLEKLLIIFYHNNTCTTESKESKSKLQIPEKHP